MLSIGARVVMYMGVNSVKKFSTLHIKLIKNSDTIYVHKTYD